MSESISFHEVGTTLYCSTYETDVTIVFAEALDSGNMYMVHYVTVTDEDVYNEEMTRIIGTEPKKSEFYERIFEHKNLGHPELYESKETYQLYQNVVIQEIKSTLSKDDYWINELFGAYIRENEGFREHGEAMRQIIKEKTGCIV